MSRPSTLSIKRALTRSRKKATSSSNRFPGRSRTWSACPWNGCKMSCRAGDGRMPRCLTVPLTTELNQLLTRRAKKLLSRRGNRRRHDESSDSGGRPRLAVVVVAATRRDRPEHRPFFAHGRRPGGLRLDHPGRCSHEVQRFGAGNSSAGARADLSRGIAVAADDRFSGLCAWPGHCGTNGGAVDARGRAEFRRHGDGDGGRARVGTAGGGAAGAGPGGRGLCHRTGHGTRAGRGRSTRSAVHRPDPLSGAPARCRAGAGDFFAHGLFHPGDPAERVSVRVRPRRAAVAGRLFPAIGRGPDVGGLRVAGLQNLELRRRHCGGELLSGSGPAAADRGGVRRHHARGGAKRRGLCAVGCAVYPGLPRDVSESLSPNPTRPGGDGGPVIELVNATVGAGGRPDSAAVEAIHWRISAGDYWVVGGLPGSGKSDLLATLAGLYRPTSGTLKLFGNDVAGLSEEEITAARLRI